MPKRALTAIRSSSDLRYSRVYGTGERLTHGCAAVETAYTRYVQGYTGHDRIHKPPLNVMDTSPKRLPRSIPGYTGFLPSVVSESVFGHPHGVVASACSKLYSCRIFRVGYSTRELPIGSR